MFGSIQTTLIAMAIAVVIASVSTATVTYKYTSSHYKQIISEQQLAAQTALTKATNTVLEKERTNAKIVADLNQKAIAQDKIIADSKFNLDKLYNERKRLYVANARCTASSSVAVAASNSSSARPSEASTGVCELDGRFSEFLGRLATDASKMRETLLICQQYSQEIEKQRAEMSTTK